MNEQPPLPSESEFSQNPDTKDCLYCGEEILAKAKKCKHCGEFLDASLRSERQQQQSPAPSSVASRSERKPELEKTEFEAHPAMFRNNPIGFILSVILIFLYGIGILILLNWWLKCLGTTLTITNKKTILRFGILSKSTNEMYHSDIRNVQVSANMFQRMLGVGTIAISSAGTGDIEIAVAGIPNPEKAKEIIFTHRR
jgi:hypothetical protein